MKKKSTSQSAPARRNLGEGGFFNLRVLFGLFIALAGVSLALAGFGAFSVQAQQQKYKITTTSTDPLVPAMIDCSKITELGIDRQENLRAGAIMIYCGLSEGGKAAPGHAFSKLVQSLMAPLAYGDTDVDLITGTESFPNVTQSETFTTANPDNPDQNLRRIGLRRWRFNLHAAHQGQRSKPLRQHLWRSCYSVQQAVDHLVHGLAGWGLRWSGLGRL